MPTLTQFLQALTLPVAIGLFLFIAVAYLLTLFLCRVINYFLTLCMFGTTCPHCDGLGVEANMMTCRKCKGKGVF